MATPNKNLDRGELAKALTDEGYPTAKQTLARKAVEGSGPPFRVWGRRPIYDWPSALRWAETRAGKPRNSTSEADASRKVNSTGEVDATRRSASAGEVGAARKARR